MSVTYAWNEYFFAVRPAIGRLSALSLPCACSNWQTADRLRLVFFAQVLHRDVESHGKIVSSVVKVCDRATSPSSRQAARTLESRWHHLFLRSLEWQCHLESLAAKIGAPVSQEPLRSLSFVDPWALLQLYRLSSCLASRVESLEMADWDTSTSRWIRIQVGLPCYENFTSQFKSSYAAALIKT